MNRFWQSFFLHKSYICDFRWLCAVFSWQLEPQWEKLLLNVLVPSSPAPNTQLCHPRTSLFTVDIKKKSWKWKKTSFPPVSCPLFFWILSIYFSSLCLCLFLHLYTGFTEKEKKTEAKEEKKLESSANAVAETLSTGGKGKRNNAGKGMYW